MAGSFSIGILTASVIILRVGLGLLVLPLFYVTISPGIDARGYPRSLGYSANLDRHLPPLEQAFLSGMPAASGAGGTGLSGTEKYLA